MILVLGASGYIGSFLYNMLQNEEHGVIGTYFRNRKKGLLHFDLEHMDITELGLNAKKLRYIIIAAATMTRIDETKIYWDKAYYINVTQMSKIIDYCFQNDIVPIYLSTDNVFNGKKGNYSEQDERNPINYYGKIRYEVENYLINSNKEFIIIRMGKVFGIEMKDGTLITSIVEALRAGKYINCSRDQVFTPLYIDDLVNFIRWSIKNRCHGIFHLASVKPITRYLIATAVERYFKLQVETINPCTIGSLGLVDERPVLIDLDTSKYRKNTGYSAKEIEYYFNLINLNV